MGGFFLGIAGTAFAVGVPFVNAWFPPERRGLAIGIFGAGMGGTAISALTTVKLFTNVGSRAPFLITAAVLAAYAVVAWLVLRDAPGRTAPTTSLMSRLSANARLPITWQACLLYAVAFGGYVAFSVYLPAYLKTAYGLTPADAANRMAGFVVVAVLMRPVGGWLSDRFGAVPVLATGYAVVVVGAGVAATHPLLEPIGAVAFLAMAAALGSGSGATFALVAKVTDSSRVGGVTGLVGGVTDAADLEEVRLDTDVRRGTGMLGADFALENGAYRIKHIVDGGAWDSEVRSPLREPGTNIREGDYLLAVNGKKVDASKEPSAAFDGIDQYHR